MVGMVLFEHFHPDRSTRKMIRDGSSCERIAGWWTLLTYIIGGLLLHTSASCTCLSGLQSRIQSEFLRMTEVELNR